jgi:hypothetical protein
MQNATSPARTAARKHRLIIHIHTDLDSLFGRACRLWMELLLAAGHEVELVNLGTDEDRPPPDLGPCDINLLIVGVYAMRRFGRFGLPRHGKHLLWMFDPLTRDDLATVHRHKTGLFDAIAPRLNAVMAMDAAIEAYVKRHFPALPVFRLPYLIAERFIRPPQPDSARRRDVLMLGGDTPRRREAEAFFLAAGRPPAEFVWTGLWGQARDDCRAESRISLNIHADQRHNYFDQFRAFETWAMGTAVISDPFGDGAEFGLEAGKHLEIALPAAMPAACAALLADNPRRDAMVAAAQTLLRERFTPAVWSDRMLAMIESLG